MNAFDPALVQHLFHGTGEPLSGDLRPGGYDGLFWTAETSAVAQTYIPASGGSVLVGVRSFELNDHVRPSQHSALYALAKQMGPAPDDVKWDRHGVAQSWRIPEGCLTNLDVVNHIENVLGYVNKGSGKDRSYEMLADGWDPLTKEHRIMPATHKRVGSLVIVDGFQSMKFLDISFGESDLSDVQYHNHSAFQRARESGYDGVVIDDFAQTKTWGNVGHRSIGFFTQAVSRLEKILIPAKRFEWGPTVKDLEIKDTPEFTTWRRACDAQKASQATTRPVLAAAC